MNNFVGPLFLVGMPRSGTKLLRGLLVQNPDIFIPSVETDFLQYWISNWSTFGNLSVYENFQKFYESQIKNTYFIDSTLDGFDCESWFSACVDYSIQGVFEALIRSSAQSTGRVYGDKSPSYIDSMVSLKGSFPEAKFIHIVRDVRDYALSVNKTWGKSMTRAAFRWAEGVRRAQSVGAEIGDDYLVIRYEDLLQKSEETLRRCCQFIGVDFVESMLSLKRNYEPAGSTCGTVSIVSTNCSKYNELMTDAKRKKIEALSADMLRVHGYPAGHIGPLVELSRIGMLSRQVYDGYAMVRYDVQRLGLLRSIEYHFRHYLSTRGGLF